MDHFARLVLLSGLQSAPHMALARSLMPGLEDSPAPGGVRWAGENSTSRKNLCFFLMVCQLALFLSQGPWTHIHESMIIHVCLAFACCHALVVWPLHAQCCSIQQGGSSMFKSNLQVATKDSQIETGRGLSDVLKSIAFPRPVYIVLKLLHGCMD